MSRQIKVEYVFPPIPTRKFVYCATYDDYDGEGSPIGYGATEREAIDELRDGEECPACKEDDAGTPCAYPSERVHGCLRDQRLRAISLSPTPEPNK